MGAAYLALGWIVVQITATLTPAFHLPEATLPMVSWIGAIGFPFVLLFSWVYELTPEGLKRESEINRSQSITHITGRKLDYTIIALLVAAIAVTALDRFTPRAGAGHARESSIPAEEEVRGHGPLLQEQTTAAPDPHSIAVLPFVNMSEDAGNAFFADGIAEELLNLLAKIPELQ